LSQRCDVIEGVLNLQKWVHSVSDEGDTGRTFFARGDVSVERLIVLCTPLRFTPGHIVVSYFGCMRVNVVVHEQFATADRCSFTLAP